MIEEIVPCRECIHRRKQGDIYRCIYRTFDVQEDEFCSLGERSGNHENTETGESHQKK